MKIEPACLYLIKWRQRICEFFQLQPSVKMESCPAFSYRSYQIRISRNEDDVQRQASRDYGLRRFRCAVVSRCHHDGPQDTRQRDFLLAAHFTHQSRNAKCSTSPSEGLQAERVNRAHDCQRVNLLSALRQWRFSARSAAARGYPARKDPRPGLSFPRLVGELRADLAVQWSGQFGGDDFTRTRPRFDT